jgi:uncharacterized SAM-binding protein YcdF (DUF218 family)
MKRWRQLLLVAGLLGGLALSGPLASLVARAWTVRSSSRSADVIVVLGGGVTWPGILTCESVFRAQHAALLYRENRAPLVLLSGGRKRGRLDLPTEAGLMAQLIRGLGVPTSAILLEEHSTRTRENGLESIALMRSHNLQSALLVTDAVHMRRAQGVFARLGADAAPSVAPTPWIFARWPHEALTLAVDLGYEWAALGFYKLRGWA